MATKAADASGRAAQYLRASSGLQIYSIPFQVEAMAGYAERHGLRIVATYTDEYRSGLDLKGRPGLQQLLTDCLADGREFDTLLVFDVSRWGRFQDLDEGAHYEFLCRRAGVRAVYCAEPFENDGAPEADLLKQVKRAIAAEFSRDLGSRIAAAKRDVSRKGFRAGTGAPYGLRRLVVDRHGKPVQVLERGQRKVASDHRIVCTPGPPDEVAAIQRIFQLYVVTGLGQAHIPRQLEREGFAPPTDRGWTESFVRCALRQPAYAGRMVWGRTSSRLNGPVLNRPPSTWITRDDAYEPIISLALFMRAQSLLKAKRRSREELLEDLRDVWRLTGRIDAAAIGATPGIASPTTYARRFGGLRAAYRAVQYRRGHPAPER